MDVGRLNINVNGIRSVGFKGNDDAFHEIMLLVGAVLPKEYIDFIRYADGGHPEVGCFYPQEGDKSNLFEIDWFYSLATDSVEKIKDIVINWGPLLGKQTLPIGRDGGGNQIYMTLGEPMPAIWLYLHDEGGIRLKISNSFEDFINSLTTNPDFI